MKKMCLGAILAACATLSSAPAQALWLLSPHVGGAGDFRWYPGQADSWRFTAQYDQTVRFKLWDNGYPGDNYFLTLNGQSIDWDTYVLGTGNREAAGSYAQGSVQLSFKANTNYVLGLIVVPCDRGCDLGAGGDWEMTPLLPAAIAGPAAVRAQPIPEPATYALFGAGIAGLCAVQMRRRRPSETFP